VKTAVMIYGFTKRLQMVFLHYLP